MQGLAAVAHADFPVPEHTGEPRLEPRREFRHVLQEQRTAAGQGDDAVGCDADDVAVIGRRGTEETLRPRETVFVGAGKPLPWLSRRVAPVVLVTGDGDEIGAWLPDQKYASVARRRAAHEFAHVDGGRRLAD